MIDLYPYSPEVCHAVGLAYEGLTLFSLVLVVTKIAALWHLLQCLQRKFLRKDVTVTYISGRYQMRTCPTIPRFFLFIYGLTFSKRDLRFLLTM